MDSWLSGDLAIKGQHLLLSFYPIWLSGCCVVHYCYRVVTLGELRRGPKYSKCEVKMNSILHVYLLRDDYYIICTGTGLRGHRVFLLRDHNIF